MPGNTVHQLRDAISLDARRLSDKILSHGKRRNYEWSFGLRKERAIVFDGKGKTGLLALHIEWPPNTETPLLGYVRAGHPDWNSDHLIMLMGTPDKAGGWFWRLVCPISHMPVQMVFLDPASKLFVSREAYGRDPGKKIASQVDFHVGLLTQMSELCQRLIERPPPKEIPVGIHNLGIDFWNCELHRQPFRIEFAMNGMPEPGFDENDNIDLSAWQNATWG